LRSIVTVIGARGLAIHLPASQPAAPEIVGDVEEGVVERADRKTWALQPRQHSRHIRRTESDDDHDLVHTAARQLADLPLDQRVGNERQEAFRPVLGQGQ
jgi:hypothetical protein